MYPLVLENVTVRKYDTPVLFALNWKVLPGQQWVVLGGNGSGKTTLLETLAGRWATASGKMHKTGTVELVANDYSFHRIARAAAQYYQQRYQAYEAEVAPTVREVLTDRMKPVGTVDERSVSLPPSPFSSQRLAEVAQLLRLEALLDQPFITLSNGETRRMLLARSLLKQPDILLLDHPFVGLDATSREVLRQALGVLTAQGVTLILATSPAEVPPCITHALFLEQGHIVQQGTLASVQIPASTLPQPTEVPSGAPSPTLLPEPNFTDYHYAFRLRGIRVVYSGKSVLDGVSWEVKKGEKWALMGPNGSGKSTLLSILTADHPQRFANDYDLFDKLRGGKSTSIWDIKRRIGHVSPELHLYFPTEATVFKTIASGFFDATGVYFRTLTDQQNEQVHTLAQLLGVEAVLTRPFRKLSKGEQRLVLLARALVKNPPLLILDEPCQGLDIAAVEHFKYLIDQICSTSERTLLYVSHYPHEIPSCVTQTFRLAQGRVV